MRSLALLDKNASTARTLNLLRIWRDHGTELEYRIKPFFDSPALSRCIIVKHRLRPNEVDIFDDYRSIGTKLLLPLDPLDLRLGARAVFVDQVGYKEQLSEILDVDLSNSTNDVRLLQALDGIPSLDPFLLREQLKRQGFQPARCYFNVSDADISRMRTFAADEITPLVAMSTKGMNDLRTGANRLAEKILSNEVDGDLDPLRLVLQLDRREFEEGVFCWKAFIYYKWQLTELLPTFKAVVNEINSVKPIGARDPERSAQLSANRADIRAKIGQAFNNTRMTLSIYDNAYGVMVNSGKPREFREFLLTSPALFSYIGEALAGVQHIASYWRFRFPKNKPMNINTEELEDLFMDFESSLMIRPMPNLDRPMQAGAT